jgi:hypothetical protein
MATGKTGALSKGRQLDDWRDYQRMRQTGEAGTKMVSMADSPGSGDLGDSNKQVKTSPGVTTETGGVNHSKKIKARPKPSNPAFSPNRPSNRSTEDLADSSKEYLQKRPSVLESHDQGEAKENYLATLLRMIQKPSPVKEDDEESRRLRETQRTAPQQFDEGDERRDQTQARIGSKFFDYYF